MKMASRNAIPIYVFAKGRTFIIRPEIKTKRKISHGHVRGRFPATMPIATRPVMLVTPEMDRSSAVSCREIPSSVALSGMKVKGMV